MEITKVRYYCTNNKDNSKFLACCSVVLDDVFILNEIKLFIGKKGKYVIMPSKVLSSSYPNDENNAQEDLFHPVDKQYFDYMSDIILKGYEVCMEKGNFTYFPK